MSDDVIEFVDKSTKEYKAGFSAGYDAASHEKLRRDFSDLDLKEILEAATYRLSLEVFGTKDTVNKHEKRLGENDTAIHILEARIKQLEKTVSRHLKHSVHWEYHEGESDETNKTNT